jgi:hypothetical protein
LLFIEREKRGKRCAVTDAYFIRHKDGERKNICIIAAYAIGLAPSTIENTTPPPEG